VAFFLRKKPLEAMASGYSYSDFAITESAKFDPAIVSQIRAHLERGGNVVITSDLLRALQGKGSLRRLPPAAMNVSQLPAIAAHLAGYGGRRPHESGGDHRRTHAQCQLRLDPCSFLNIQATEDFRPMQLSPIGDLLQKPGYGCS
jgi:hypothetical protein